MRALVQRVTEASVKVDGQIIGQIEGGFLVLMCAMHGDSEAQADKLVSKLIKLRIFSDENGKMNRSLRDIGGAALVVSQFTLAADVSRGNRPGFSDAAPPDQGAHLYEYFKTNLAAAGIPVQSGQFGADMAVHLINDGPVTIWLDI
ncbi:MAG: D-tyrosyl-tRNA(Tyr) deacylase [Paracoccaceae bacterium]|jgi:D-tyrosyl-tRNA(Tyr) deacylase